VEDWNWDTIFYGHYRSIFNHCDIFGLKICRIRWKKTPNKGYYAIQCHSRSSRSVSIESPYATSYQWLIVTDILSRTVSELSQLIVQILVTMRFWATVWGLRDNGRCSSGAHWKAHNWTFSLGVTAQSLRAKKDRKSAISLQCGHFYPKFQVERVVPHQSFLHG